MQLTARRIILILLVIAFIWVLYVERSILPPFVLAAIFAYIFNPVVSLFQKRLKIPRTLSVIFIYVTLIFLIFTSFSYIGGQLLAEANQLSNNDKGVDLLGGDLSYLPEWNVGNGSFGLQSLARELVSTLGHTAQSLQDNIWPYFSLAANQLINLFIFLVSAFYLLKEGDKLVGYIKSLLPNKYHSEFEEILTKINRVLGDYLRGEIILVAIMSILTWIALTILGVRFALLIGILTGFLELIPYFGPLIAASIAAMTVFITGNNNFGFDPFTLALVIGLMFFTFRQLEDYFVIPQVLSRATKLHPLVVMFSVIAGGHTAGALGFIIAVPIVSTIRVLLPYLLSKVQ